MRARYVRFQVIETHGGYQPFVSELNFWYYSPTTTQTTVTTTTVATTSTTNTIIEYLSGKLSGIEAAMEKQIVDTAAKVKAMEASLEAAHAENKALKIQLDASVDELKSAVDISEGRSLDRNEGLASQVAALYAGLQNISGTLSQPASAAAPDLPPPAACKGEEGAPTVQSNGLDLNLNACSGEVLLTSQSCSVNPCATQAMVARLVSLLQDLGQQ